MQFIAKCPNCGCVDEPGMHAAYCPYGQQPENGLYPYIPFGDDEAVEQLQQHEPESFEVDVPLSTEVGLDFVLIVHKNWGWNEAAKVAEQLQRDDD